MVVRTNIFEKTIPELIEFRQGEVANQVDMLNQPIKALNDLRNGAALPELVQEQQVTGGGGSGTFEFKVVRLPPKADFVICNRVIGGEADTDEIQIALPSKLRAEKQQGGVDYEYPMLTTGERNGTDPVTLRQQREVISDPYGIGDELWAWNVSVLVSRTPDPTVDNPQPEPVVNTYEWLDANNDSRRWLALPIEGSIGETLEPPG